MQKIFRRFRNQPFGEYFVNVCSYAYEGKKGSVELSIEISNEIRIIFCDSGMPFNPLENIVDIDDYEMEEQVGGLGRMISLVDFFHIYLRCVSNYE